MSEKPDGSVATAVSAFLPKLLPDEVSLEAYNSQFMQKHSTRGDAVLAAAKVSQALGAPREEVEAAVFNVLNADVELDIEVRQSSRGMANVIELNEIVA